MNIHSDIAIIEGTELFMFDVARRMMVFRCLLDEPNLLLINRRNDLRSGRIGTRSSDCLIIPPELRGHQRAMTDQNFLIARLRACRQKFASVGSAGKRLGAPGKTSALWEVSDEARHPP